jgi:hypothetical protein
MVEKIPFILSIKYFTFFLFDKNQRRLTLVSHNHPDIKEEYSLYQNDSPIIREATTSGRYIFEQDLPIHLINFAQKMDDGSRTTN